ncbi:hypothetical protein Aph01nite_22170 [Acrocarpospora phusangensis]|uniref:Uncharacterized protein n=1 Tax=Acrocarpospora phusangensis TaxID=1070424 RepID=A0A919QCS0_9ACTN|nr:DUF6461 domain-containing protein [Acrocarpospora phusangensis]GIH23907.1 hypothetical protein Aph01nite_22170 [Acrocarpospora phusangensis]
MHPADAKYAELTDGGLPDQLCLTWVQEPDIDEVARRFGADVESKQWADEDTIAELEEDYQAELIHLVTIGGWTLALAPNGYQGSRSEVMESLSAQGRAFSVYWSAAMDSAVSYAVDGVVQTEFDLAEVEQRTGADPSALDPFLAELGVSDELSLPELQARCLALGQKLSGALFPPEWLHSPRYVFKIVDPLPDAIVPPAYLDPRAPFLDEPEFARILADPSPAMAPAVNRKIATTVIAIAGIEDPIAGEVLRLLDTGERFPGERQELKDRLIRQADAAIDQAKSLGGGPEADRVKLTANALAILHGTLWPEPAEAASAASMQVVSMKVPNRIDFMRLIVLRNVSEHIMRALRADR